MRKVFLVCLLCLSMPLLSGCTNAKGKELPNINETDIDHINRIGVKDALVCIDGIEYIFFRNGYAGYMAPHLTTDADNNPKVIRCGGK